MLFSPILAVSRQSSRSINQKKVIRDTPKLLEKLSELEHEQWIHYSKSIARQIKRANTLEQLIESSNNKWAKNWKDYSLLPEAEKNKDREWAVKVIQLLKENKDLLDDVIIH